MYDAAFSYNNHFIYETPDIPVKAEDYSVNFMWINEYRMSQGQEFLFDDPRSLQEFVESVSNWAKVNPGSAINIWIDGEMATPGAIERTHAALQHALDGASHTIRFRDIRSIETVRLNSAAFIQRMPIYFRVDLLRAITADHLLRNKESKYFVYADLDMQAHSGEDLFDKRTIDFLNDYGFVMAKGGHLGFENGFQILNGDNHQLMDSHRKVIIDLSMAMALQEPQAIKQQQIYDTYPAMLTHFLDADGRYGKIKTTQGCFSVLGNDLECYRYDRFGAYTELPLDKANIRLGKAMPTKPVRLPRSHFY